MSADMTIRLPFGTRTTPIAEDQMENLLNGTLTYGKGVKKIKGGKRAGRGPTCSGVPFAFKVEDDGNVQLVMPAGTPAFIARRANGAVTNTSRALKVRARLAKKLAEKHEHHTGEECDKCFWDAE